MALPLAKNIQFSVNIVTKNPLSRIIRHTWPGNIQTKIKTIGLEKVVKVYSHSSLSVVGALMMQTVKIRKEIAVAVVTLQ